MVPAAVPPGPCPSVRVRPLCWVAVVAASGASYGGTTPVLGWALLFQCYFEMVGFFKRICKHLLNSCYFPLALKLKGTFISLLFPLHTRTSPFSILGPSSLNSPASHHINVLQCFADRCFLLHFFCKFCFIFTKTICHPRHRSCPCLSQCAGPWEGAFHKSRTNSWHGHGAAKQGIWVSGAGGGRDAAREDALLKGFPPGDWYLGVH